MKKLISIIIVAMFMMTTGCATVKLATSGGSAVGSSFIESATKGGPVADESIAAWPYASGLIKGLLAANFEFTLPVVALDIMEELDIIAEKALTEELTMEEKGYVIGCFVRLEHIGTKVGWDKYGVSLWSIVTGK